jgi:uroporphyrinogen-III decarboxylase
MIMAKTALYQERFDRIKKAINLEPVDRVPVVFQAQAFSARYMGIPMDKYCSSSSIPFWANLDAMDRFDGLDGANTAPGGRIHLFLSMAWMSKVAAPGKELPSDSLWQVQEGELMTIEDYDTIINKGWGKYVNSFLPRVVNMREFLSTVIWLQLNTKRIHREYIKRDYVLICDAPGIQMAPFEALCGGRSMTKFFFDLYRMPDKIEAVLDVILAENLAAIAKLKPDPAGINGEWIGGWRGASGLVAPKLWDRFIWPYILKLAEALIDKGITPVLHWDQDWSRDLERLKELPAKKCILNPDGMTDMVQFKKLVGDRMAMMGDVPSSMLAAGTPEDVENYVRDRIELFEGKGLIMCPGCDGPINTKPENMKALIEATHKYGTM